MFPGCRALLKSAVWWVPVALVCALAPRGAVAASTVDVVIDMRAEIAAARFDPRRDGVGVRGARAPLSWAASAPAHDDTGSGLYRVRLHFDPADDVAGTGQAVAYKFKVEHPDSPAGGWEPGRNRALVLKPGVHRLERVFAVRVDGDAPPVQRSGHIERLAAAPSALVGAREVQVWLPPGYADAAPRRYPVLYLNDGQNVFDAAAAGAEWQVDETALRLVAGGEVAPMIVVAVSSTEARVDDYTPVPQDLPGRGRVGGAAARYGRYLVEELKPLIDARYRTRSARADTALGGSSLGGLVSMWLLLEHPATFGAALVVSPSVWWGANALLGRIEGQGVPTGVPVPRIWLDVGSREGEGAVAGTRRLRDALWRHGWSPAYLEDDAGGHDEAAWAARVEPMLRFLYGTPVR